MGKARQRLVTTWIHVLVVPVRSHWALSQNCKFLNYHAQCNSNWWHKILVSFYRLTNLTDVPTLHILQMLPKKPLKHTIFGKYSERSFRQFNLISKCYLILCFSQPKNCQNFTIICFLCASLPQHNHKLIIWSHITLPY